MSRQLKSIALLCCVVGMAGIAEAQLQTAAVTGGRVEGIVAGEIASFKGIPFAAPPVGDNRWRAPQPLQPWNGTLQADAFAPACMQDMTIGAAVGDTAQISEDCLYLNVWTPARSVDERLPVMVWIYGGGFAIGSTSTPSYDGTRFAERGVVLVSVAYRVGPFGFMAHRELSLESGGGSGNYGLQDMLAGLRWVRDSIQQFGGDPQNVTIFGESAGAIAVSMLTVVPQARGLFHRAISQSGGSFAPPGMDVPEPRSPPTLAMAEAQGAGFLQQLGVDTIAEARALDAAAVQRVLPPGLATVFWPVADGDVLPGDQTLLYEAGRFHDTPVMIGTNSDEGAMFATPGMNPQMFEASVRAGYGDSADSILGAYPHDTPAEAVEAGKDMFRDSIFAWSTWSWAKLLERHGASDAFVYYFDHRTPASPDGANHAAEIPYVFGNLAGGGIFSVDAASEANQRMSDLMMRYWVSFTTDGDPNDPGLPQWPAFDEASEQVMFFDADSGARPLPNRDQLRAMDAYFASRRGRL